MDYRLMTAPCGLDCFNKVFNLCLINKLGLDQWARTKAAEVRRTYFNTPWTLA